MTDSLSASVKKLIAKGKQRGYLTYEEMNEDLPDEAVSPDKLDSLLMTLDELGIELLDESEVDRRENAAVGEGFLNATELADYLVGKGMPFREAHAVVGQMVRYASEKEMVLDDLTLEEMRHFSDLIEGDVSEILSAQKAVERRTSDGGTSPSSVKKQILGAMKIYEAQGDFADSKRKSIEKAFERLQA